MIFDPQQARNRFNADKRGYTKSMPIQQKQIIETFLDYYHNPHLIPQLAFLDKQNKNGENRQKRAERRMAHSLILCAITLKLDFGSSQIGSFCPDGSFKFTTLVELAEIAGLELRDGEEEDAEIIGVSQRFARAWRDLKAAKVVGQIEQIIKVLITRNGTTTEEFRAVPAIKFISPKLFLQIGAVTANSLKTIQEYSRSKRPEIIDTDAKNAARLRKVYKRKPRMSKRIKAILDSQWQSMLRMYRMLKLNWPNQAPNWYRGKVAQAFPS